MTNFKWTGPKVDSYNGFSSKNCDFYRSFVFNKQCFNVGDFAIFNKTEYDNLDRIGRIVSVYESHDAVHAEEKYRGSVRWYSWARRLEKRLNPFKINFDINNEVIEDFRQKDIFISLETIKRKVRVVFASPEDPINLINHMKLNPDLYFSCRYRIVEYQLEPIFTDSSNVLTVINDFNAELNSPLKSKLLKSMKDVEKNLDLVHYIANEIVDSKSNTKNSSEKRKSIQNHSLLSPKLKSTVKRNLNASFLDDSDGSDTSVLNYSVVDELISTENTLKIKLKLSDKRKNNMQKTTDKIKDFHVEINKSKNKNSNKPSHSKVDNVNGKSSKENKINEIVLPKASKSKEVTFSREYEMSPNVKKSTGTILKINNSAMTSSSKTKRLNEISPPKVDKSKGTTSPKVNKSTDTDSSELEKLHETPPKVDKLKGTTSPKVNKSTDTGSSEVEKLHDMSPKIDKSTVTASLNISNSTNTDLEVDRSNEISLKVDKSTETYSAVIDKSTETTSEVESSESSSPEQKKSTEICLKSTETTPLKINKSVRRSSRLTQRKSYAELITPEKYIHSKRDHKESIGSINIPVKTPRRFKKIVDNFESDEDECSYDTLIKEFEKENESDNDIIVIIDNKKLTETISTKESSSVDDKNDDNILNKLSSDSLKLKQAKVVLTRCEISTPSKCKKKVQERKTITTINEEQTTPKKSRLQELDEEESSPKKSKTLKTPKTPKVLNRKAVIKTPCSKSKLFKEGAITPSMHNRQKAVKQINTPLSKARCNLHVSYVPNALSCREKEFLDIYNFIEGKLQDGCGGCMYVSGVPGTGKTATVTAVIKKLQNASEIGEIPTFDYIEINGMKLTEPRQAYVEILKQLTGKPAGWEQAQHLLEVRFAKPKKALPPVVLIVDELDVLCTKRQDVVYNLLDWPTKVSARLVVVTIANTMDLPERLLMSRVTSRLGLTRLTFQAYTFKQLQEIVTKRLLDTGSFNVEAVQLVSRKVASVSGDARRALDICRRAAEIAENEGVNATVTITHVNEALNAMITQPKVQAVQHCSKLEQLILQAIVVEVERTGVEETTFADVYKMLISLAPLNGFEMVSTTLALAAVSRLNSCRLILADQKCNNIGQKIILNISSDDVYYALRKD